MANAFGRDGAKGTGVTAAPAGRVATAFGGRFRRHVLLPVGLVAAVAAAAAGVALHATTTATNKMAIERQFEIVHLAIGGAVDDLAYEEQSDAEWDPLVKVVSTHPLDKAWLNENCGTWLYDMFGHDLVTILDAGDQPIYAARGGREVPAANYGAIRNAMQPLVDGVRGLRPVANGGHSRGPGPSRPGATVRTRVTTVHVSDVVMIAGRPAVASAMLVASPSETREGAVGIVMVVAKYLDGSYLADLGRRSGLAGLRFAAQADPGDGESVSPLRDDDGNALGYFIWSPMLPGTVMLHALLPVTICSVGALILALGLLLHSLWRSTNALDRTLVELRESEAQAHHLAGHDALTSLANRSLFAERLDAAVAAARSGDGIGVLAADLDRFKQVNDSFGHPFGDRLLVEVGRRLTELVRPGDTVARFGGDEFVILLRGVTERGQIDEICARISRALRQPFELGGVTAFIGVSLGSAIAPDDAADSSDLLRKADIALYRAKAEGRNGHRAFEAAMERAVRDRGELEEQLRAALATGRDIEVHYQPIVAGRGFELVGYEALVRWRHPLHGMLGPDRFVPLAEETGLVHALGHIVLTQAARTAARHPEVFMAVNVSPMQMREAAFCDTVLAVLGAAGCRPDAIELEVTESVFMEEDARIRATMDRLRREGIRIALDDFGTGYSSVGYLYRFPVDKIKIDRVFTDSLGRTAEAAAIVNAVLTLGHAMGLTVTAEGVETEGQREFLSAAGCDQLQGYLFSRPLSEIAPPRDAESAA